MIKISVTEDQKELIIDALNNYYHYSNDKAKNKESGDLEKRQYKSIRDKCKRLMSKLNPF